MGFLAVAFVLLLVLVEQVPTCFTFNRGTSLSEYKNKLEQKLATSPLPQPPSASSPAASSQPKLSGRRVLYPSEYGADPSGAKESSDAILKAVENGFEMHKEGLQFVEGVNDLGGVVIDLQGGNYKIIKPITFPSSGGGNLVVEGGTLRASDTFPGDRHLVELWSSNSKKLENSY